MFLPMSQPPPIYYYNKAHIKYMKEHNVLDEPVKPETEENCNPTLFVGFVVGFLMGCFFTSMVMLFFKDSLP